MIPGHRILLLLSFSTKRKHIIKKMCVKTGQSSDIIKYLIPSVTNYDLGDRTSTTWDMKEQWAEYVIKAII